MTTFGATYPGPRKFLWPAAGLILVLVATVLIFAVRNVRNTRAHMERTYLDHGEALFWALEAGTRIGMGMHGRPGYFQSLVEETARQHGIVYLAVVDGDGLVLNHSNATLNGSRLQLTGSLHPGTELQGQMVERAGQAPVFEIAKRFSPFRGKPHAMWCGTGNCPPGRGGGRGQMGAAPMDTTIVLGLDPAALEHAVAEERRASTLIGLLGVLLGLGGFGALFWGQHYRRSRRLLQDTRAFAAEVVACLPQGLLTTDARNRIVLVNDVAAALFGREPAGLAGQPLQMVSGIDWAPVLAGIGSGAAERECEIVTAEGGAAVPVGISASRIINDDGDFLGNLFLLRDLRELRRLQAQARRNERLSALGNLAAGVAHEIRNPLSSIKGFATYLSGKVREQDREAARAMVQEAERLNRVVSELLEFARPGDVVLRPGDLNDIVERTLRLVGEDARLKNIIVDFERNAALPPVRMDAERLTQALLNLFLNAIQAMDSGGTLRIRSGPGADSDHVDLRIEDTGAGMTPEVMQQIFNPYFTTKSSGTGLGLAIVHGIVEGHGAEIRVESVVGTGSVFTLSLTAAGRDA